MSRVVPLAPPKRLVDVEIDGKPVRVPEGSTILDACRRDYLTEENAPFLHGLMQKGVTASIESPPGFTQRTTMFTGSYPDTSNAFSAFGYDPANSPFKWMRKLGPCAGLYRPRKGMFPFRLAVKRISRWTSGQYHTDPAWIPGAYLPSFSIVEDHKPIFEEGAMPLPGIFDLLIERGTGRPRQIQRRRGFQSP